MMYDKERSTDVEMSSTDHLAAAKLILRQYDGAVEEIGDELHEDYIDDLLSMVRMVESDYYGAIEYHLAQMDQDLYDKEIEAVWNGTVEVSERLEAHSEERKEILNEDYEDADFEDVV